MNFSEMLKTDANWLEVEKLRKPMATLGFLFPNADRMGDLVDNPHHGIGSGEMASALSDYVTIFHRIMEACIDYGDNHEQADFLEPGDTPTPEPDFIEMTPDDEANIAGGSIK